MVTTDVIYEAVYTDTFNGHTITWDMDGCQVVANYNLGDKVVAPGDTTKAGSVFTGWKEKDNKVAAVPATMPDQDLTFEAQWLSAIWELELPYTPGTLTETGAFFEPETLTFSPADPAVGRLQEGYRVGYKFIAPEVLTANNIDDAKYSNDGGDTWKFFKSSQDGQQDDGRFFIRCTPSGSDAIPPAYCS